VTGAPRGEQLAPGPLARPSSTPEDPGSLADYRQRRWNGYGLTAIPVAIFLAIFFIWPLVDFFVRGADAAGGPFEHVADLFTNRFERGVLLETFKLATATTIVCLLLGYPVALLIASVSKRWRAPLLLLIFIPFWTSVLVRTFSWRVILGGEGPINNALEALGIIDTPLPLVYNFTGVVIGMVQVLLPYMVLPILAVMLRLDRRLLRAAESMGASPLQV